MALFHDPLLYRFFEAAGVTPRKSRTLGGLSAPTEHIPDVIRGLLDGDGSVMARIEAPMGRNNPYRRLRLRLVFYSGSRAHLEWLRGILANLAIRSSWFEDRRTVNPSYRLTLTDRQAATLLSTIYEDPRAPRLERKWLIWDGYRRAQSLPGFYAFL
jgi:hypothetical protein